MVFALYWDDAAEGNPPKIARAVYATKKEAEVQRDHDLERGRRVLCIEQLSEVKQTELNRGKVVWEA